MSTPPIWCQRGLAAGDRLAERCDVPPGRYRLRTLEAGPQEDVTLEPGAPLREIVVSGEGVGLGDVGEAGKGVLRNAAARRHTVIVEDRRWVLVALTAARVTTLQSSRDSFSHEVRRPRYQGEDAERRRGEKRGAR